MNPHPPAGDLQDSLTDATPAFRPLRVVGFVLFIMLAISGWLKWYTGAVSLPRYCDDPVATLHYLEKVLKEPRPAGDERRRPYIIAAKLIYLIPQLHDESIEAYLHRLEIRLAEQCR